MHEKKPTSDSKSEFIDLFAGLGGFHLALRELGHKCVFASEINEELRKSYETNFGITPEGDIRSIPTDNIPKHRILCAGFPCQPFSKAGFQKGMKDPERGTLFFQIIRIIKARKPEYFILENVPNIIKHNEGKTWKKIKKSIEKQGYEVATEDLSPHHFGIPQIRLRTYIIGKRGKLNGFKWPTPDNSKISNTILNVLEKNPPNAKKIPSQIKQCLDVWQEFLNILPDDEKIPHPLWSMEFGATYPYEKSTPHRMRIKDLVKYRGSFGQRLKGTRKKEIFKYLPSHARRPNYSFPRWKVNMIRRNREFYLRNKKTLDNWLEKIKVFPSSFQKLEWNVGDGKRDIHNYIIQCRASGIRVKRVTTSPSLVAMNNTQIPIIPWEGRYMAPQECVRLQSMEKLKVLPVGRSKTFSALGNAVNVQVVYNVVKNLVQD